MLEKTLDEILGVGRRIAAPPNECVERRPIRFAKSGERFPRRFVGVALARLQNDRPMRRLEWRTALLQRPWNRFGQAGRVWRERKIVKHDNSLPRHAARR